MDVLPTRRLLIKQGIPLSGTALTAGLPNKSSGIRPVTDPWPPEERKFRVEMKEIAERHKFTVANETKDAPNIKGWYHHFVTVVATPDGLVCCYRRTDLQTSILGDITVSHSTDKVTLHNASLTRWRSKSVKVENQKDHSLDWSWNACQVYSDQFRRDRIVRLDQNGSFAADNCSYCGWDQMQDGTIVIADYTVGNSPTRKRCGRAYVTSEAELTS